MGLSWQHLLIVLVIALVIFGTKRLRSIGSDLGAAVRGFKKAVNDNDEEAEAEEKEKERRRELPRQSAPDAEFDESSSSSRTGERTKKS